MYFVFVAATAGVAATMAGNSAANREAVATSDRRHPTIFPPVPPVPSRHDATAKGDRERASAPAIGDARVAGAGRLGERFSTNIHYSGGGCLPEPGWAFQRRRAMPAQMNSTTPKGQAPDRKPYMLESTHPAANPSTNLRARCSSAYIVIMNVSANTPNAVTATVPVDHAVLLPAMTSSRSSWTATRQSPS